MEVSFYQRVVSVWLCCALLPKSSRLSLTSGGKEEKDDDDYDNQRAKPADQITSYEAPVT